MSTELQTALCTMSLWKRRVAGKLVFKFQKPSDVSGAPCINEVDFKFHTDLMEMSEYGIVNIVTLYLSYYLIPAVCAVLEAVVKRKIPGPRRKSNPKTPIVRADQFILSSNVYHSGVLYKRLNCLPQKIDLSSPAEYRYTVLGPTQPIKWIPAALSPGIERPGRETACSPRADVKNVWSYTSTTQIRLHGLVLS
jgi:hypothetical protein